MEKIIKKIKKNVIKKRKDKFMTETEVKQLGSQEALSEDQKFGRQEGRLFNVCDFSKFLPKQQNDNSLTSCPPDLLTSSRKAAFTLAEVLITLAVIGVVAAMTLPVLIQKQQKMVWTSQLKKTYSVLSQGFQQMLADEGVENLTDTTVWAPNINPDDPEWCYCWYNSDYKTDEHCKPFGENLGKYFKNVGFETYGITDRYLNGSDLGDLPDAMPMILSDGTMVFWSLDMKQTKTQAQCNEIKSRGGNMCSYLGEIYIDVNGRKGPNTHGRDIFMFRLSNDGRLYPSSGKDDALYWSSSPLDNNNYYWRKNTGFCGTPGGKADESDGIGCAARIMENNWTMDY